MVGSESTLPSQVPRVGTELATRGRAFSTILYIELFNRNSTISTICDETVLHLTSYLLVAYRTYYYY